MLLKILTYKGTGVDGLQITGAGFGAAPSAAIVKDTSSGNNAILKTPEMTGNNSVSLREDSGLFTTGIKTLDSDGITVGTDGRVNTSGNTYQLFLFYNDGANDFVTGTYVGNGTNPHSITLPFPPDFVAIKGDLGRTGVYRYSTFAGDGAFAFYGTSTLANVFTSLDALGFTVNNPDYVNNNAVNYYYIAFRQRTNKIQVLSYAGNSTDNTVIATTVKPGLAWIKASNNGVNPCLRGSYSGANNSQAFDGTMITTGIKSFAYTPSITLGTDATVNQTGTTYHALIIYETNNSFSNKRTNVLRPRPFAPGITR